MLVRAAGLGKRRAATLRCGSQLRLPRVALQPSLPPLQQPSLPPLQKPSLPTLDPSLARSPGWGTSRRWCSPSRRRCRASRRHIRRFAGTPAGSRHARLHRVWSGVLRYVGPPSAHTGAKTPKVLGSMSDIQAGVRLCAGCCPERHMGMGMPSAARWRAGCSTGLPATPPVAPRRQRTAHDAWAAAQPQRYPSAPLVLQLLGLSSMLSLASIQLPRLSMMRPTATAAGGKGVRGCV